MTLIFKHKVTITASLVMLLGSHANLVLADDGTTSQAPAQNYNQAPAYNQPPPRYNQPTPRGYGYRGDYPPPRYYGYDRRYYSPYGGGPGFGGPWNNRGSGFRGPWNNRGSSFNPWGNRGGWGGGRNPFGHRGPGDWFSPDRDAWADNWDDMLNAPSRMGEMPGGWNAPSVSVPNPIDVGDEFGNAARDLPDQMDNFNWNNNRGRRYYR